MLWRRSLQLSFGLFRRRAFYAPQARNHALQRRGLFVLGRQHPLRLHPMTDLATLIRVRAGDSLDQASLRSAGQAVSAVLCRYRSVTRHRANRPSCGADAPTMRVVQTGRQ